MSTHHIEDAIDSEVDAMWEVKNLLGRHDLTALTDAGREGRRILCHVWIHLQARLRAIATEGR